MSNSSEVNLVPLTFFDIDGCHIIAICNNGLVLGRTSRINRKFVLPAKSYCWILRNQFLEWVETLIICFEVLLDLKTVEYHSRFIQKPTEGFKVVCSFEESGITLKTNEPTSSVTLNLTTDVVKRLLEGFSSLLLPPFCATAYQGFKIYNFVNFLTSEPFDLENENLVWEALKKVFADESEDFYSDMALTIRLIKTEIVAASKALFYFNKYKMLML